MAQISYFHTKKETSKTKFLVEKVGNILETAKSKWVLKFLTKNNVPFVWVGEEEKMNP